MIVRRTYETSCIFQWFRIYITISNCIYHISVSSSCTCWIVWSFWLISCVLKLSWSWSYGSCTYNYLCNRRSSPPKLWVQIPLMARCTRWNLCDKVNDFAAGRWFSPLSSINTTDHHDITEILLKVTLNTLPSVIDYRYTWYTYDGKP